MSCSWLIFRNNISVVEIQQKSKHSSTKIQKYTQSFMSVLYILSNIEGLVQSRRNVTHDSLVDVQDNDSEVYDASSPRARVMVVKFKKGMRFHRFKITNVYFVFNIITLVLAEMVDPRTCQ